MGGQCPVMNNILLLLLLAGVSHTAKLVEQREIKTSSGNTFNCFYTINYNARGVNKKKSSVTCDPNENGGTAIEVFDLPDVGKISLKHSVKEGKDKIQDFSPYTEPASAVMPMNCSCKVPFPTEMTEMMSSSGMMTQMAGRRLAPMLMTHDSESNRKVLKVNREFNRQLFGGLGGGLGSGALLGQIGNGGLLGGLAGENTGGTNPLDVLGGLTGGNTGGTNPLDLLGALTGGGASPADLAAIISSGGDPAELLSNPLVQNMIQQVVQQQMEEYMNNGGPEEMINQVMAMSDEEMMAMIMPFIPEDIQGTVQELAAMSDEEFFQHMMDQMGMNGGLEGMLAGMGDMGDVGVNMTDIIAQWEAPFDVYCDCLPTDMEMATFT